MKILTTDEIEKRLGYLTGGEVSIQDRTFPAHWLLEYIQYMGLMYENAKREKDPNVSYVINALPERKRTDFHNTILGYVREERGSPFDKELTEVIDDFFHKEGRLIDNLRVEYANKDCNRKRRRSRVNRNSLPD